jgi:hypothetical protein
LVKAIPKVYDAQRTVRLLYEDGSSEMQVLNEPIIDQQTGEIVTLNDLTKGQYSVACRAGPSFRNRQQETIETIIEIAKVDPSIIGMAGDILLNAIPTSAATQIGERKRLQMMAQGLIPQTQLTEEEKAQMAQSAQGQEQQQDPAMVLAQAEMAKAQAEQMRAQVEVQRLQLDTAKIQLEAQKVQMQMQADQATQQLDVFNAQTQRMNTQIKAQQAGASIEKDAVDTQGKQIDNQLKIVSALNPFRSQI